MGWFGISIIVLSVIGALIVMIIVIQEYKKHIVQSRFELEWLQRQESLYHTKVGTDFITYEGTMHIVYPQSRTPFGDERDLLHIDLANPTAHKTIQVCFGLNETLKQEWGIFHLEVETNDSGVELLVLIPKQEPNSRISGVIMGEKS